jgi:glycosyltransferase involved in cell wall biosynthesis
MKYVKSPVRLVVAGRPESAEYAERLWQCVQENGLERRVRLMLEFITEREKAELYANAIGTVYIPYDEDSYGYVPLESFHSGKAVLTCTDSGGTDVLVRHGETGLVAPPDPKALAAAFDTLFLDKANAIRMGEAGRELIGRLNISWDHVIASLTS